MIKIEINGVDPYLVLGYSKDHTTNLANLFEVSEEDLIFVAHDDLPIYKGVDQTSWNAVVHVFLQEKYEPVEKLVAKYLLNTLNELSVHVNLDFIYLHSYHSLFLCDSVILSMFHHIRQTHNFFLYKNRLHL